LTTIDLPIEFKRMKYSFWVDQKEGYIKWLMR